MAPGKHAKEEDPTYYGMVIAHEARGQSSGGPQRICLLRVLDVSLDAEGRSVVRTTKATITRKIQGPIQVGDVVPLRDTSREVRSAILSHNIGR